MKIEKKEFVMGKITILTMIMMLCMFGYSLSLPTMDEIRTSTANKEVNIIDCELEGAS